jgi:hypothetical protein
MGPICAGKARGRATLICQISGGCQVRTIADRRACSGELLVRPVDHVRAITALPLPDRQGAEGGMVLSMEEAPSLFLGHTSLLTHNAVT